MSQHGFEDLRERKFLLDERETIELKGDGSADLVTATTQFGEDEDGNQTDSEVEIYGESILIAR